MGGGDAAPIWKVIWANSPMGSDAEQVAEIGEPVCPVYVPLPIPGWYTPVGKFALHAFNKPVPEIFRYRLKVAPCGTCTDLVSVGLLTSHAKPKVCGLTLFSFTIKNANPILGESMLVFTLSQDRVA